MAACVLIFYGTMLSSGMLDEFNDFENDGYYEDDDYYNSEVESDSINTWEDDDYIIEEEMDSINIEEME